MNVYIYAADLYCEDCGKALREKFIREGYAPEMHDSIDLPQGPFPDGGGESDTPQHCGAGPKCENAIELSNNRNYGRKIGAWLGNELTADGVEYVREAIREGGEVVGLWAGFYRDYDLKEGE